MLVEQRLLRTPTPPAASVLRSTGSVPDSTLVKLTKMAENRITSVVVKAKLHILACDQPWAYDAIASSSNAGNTDQATYTIPHSLDANAAATLAEAFRSNSVAAGTPVDAVVNGGHFFITTLPAYTGPEVHVYSAEGAIVDANAETGTAVGVDGVTMDVVQTEINDATPTNLRRAIKAGNHLPAIVQGHVRGRGLPSAAEGPPEPAAPRRGFGRVGGAGAGGRARRGGAPNAEGGLRTYVE